MERDVHLKQNQKPVTNTHDINDSNKPKNQQNGVKS